VCVVGCGMVLCVECVVDAVLLGIGVWVLVGVGSVGTQTTHNHNNHTKPTPKQPHKTKPTQINHTQLDPTHPPYTGAREGPASRFRNKFVVFSRRGYPQYSVRRLNRQTSLQISQHSVSAHSMRSIGISAAAIVTRSNQSKRNESSVYMFQLAAVIGFRLTLF
jgi:hypothetical protein